MLLLGHEAMRKMNEKTCNMPSGSMELVGKVPQVWIPLNLIQLSCEKPQAQAEKTLNEG